MKIKISFLDVTVTVNHGEFIIDIYCKPTKGHQYLQSESNHTKSLIIICPSLRMRIIWSNRSDLIANIRKIKDWIRDIGY